MLKQYLPICWFGQIPENLKTSKSFLWRNLVLYICAGLFIQANITDPVQAFLQIIIELIITVVFVFILLKITKSSEKFSVVFTAFIICENFFYMCALPIAIWYMAVRTSEYSMIPVYAGIVLVIWFCAMISHLLQKLFDFRITLSILLSIFYFIVTYLVSFALLLM
jgi:hypothetical protein